MKDFIQPKRLLVVAGLALAIPLAALASPGGKGGGCEARDGMRKTAMHGGHGMMGEPMMMRGLHRLDLSEAQQDKIFEIMHGQAPAAREQMKSLRKSEQALQALKATPDFSDAKARQLVDQIAKQRADMEMSRLQTERKVLDLLSPEQRKQLAEMKPGPRGDDRGPRS